MAHNNYYLDLCAEVFVVHNDMVLLRLHEKYNIWIGPGGHIDAGEDANEAAIREVKEETGLQVTLVGPTGWEATSTQTNRDLVPPIFLNRHKINEHHDHSTFIFVGVTDSTVVKAAYAAEETESRWCTKEALDDLLINDGRLDHMTYRYACHALEIVNNQPK